MFFLPFLGLWLRFVIVYKFNWSKMDIAYRKDKNLEKDKDLVYGIYGFIIIVALIVLYQIFFNYGLLIN